MVEIIRSPYMPVVPVSTSGYGCMLESNGARFTCGEVGHHVAICPWPP